MKKTILLFIAILTISFGFAQTDNGLNFKGLVTNNGNPIANSTISVKVTLKRGTTTEWAETHSNVHTDANGIFSIVIGEGTRTGGVASNFKNVHWAGSSIKYTVQVNAGSGYHTLVNDEPFKYVPYAKLTERLADSYFPITVKNTSSTSNGVIIESGLGHFTHGFSLKNGSDDWYIFMGSDKSFKIRNDNQNVLVISDTDNSVWIKGKLKANDMIEFDGYLKGLKYLNGNNFYLYRPNSASNYGFYYGNSLALGLQGSVGVNIPGYLNLTGKLKNSTSGDADMKAYIYGAVNSNGTKVTQASSNGFSVTKLSSGHYKVTFTNSVNANNYIVLVTNSGSYGNSAVYRHTGYFDVFIRNIDSNNYLDSSFQFVVYKK